MFCIIFKSFIIRYLRNLIKVNKLKSLEAIKRTHLSGLSLIEISTVSVLTLDFGLDLILDSPPDSTSV